MYQKQRLEKILSLLDERGQLSSKEAIELLSVSRDTIRRDFALLTENQQVIRTHGGILPLKKDNAALSFNERLNNLSKEKTAMAQKAKQLLKDNQLCFLDVSTTMLKIAQLLDQPATVYSHSLDNALVLSQNEQVDFHLLGGKFYHKNRFYFDLNLADLIKNIHFDLAIIGAAGLKDGKISFEDEEDAQLKKLILKQSKVKILLAEESKWNKDSRYVLGHINDFDYFITDKEPSSAILQGLKEDLHVIY